MANYIIAYDLMAPGQNYQNVESAIKETGRHVKLQFSLYYVNSNFGVKEIHDYIRQFMDSNDKLAVFEASGGFVSLYPTELVDAINGVWWT